MQRAVIHNVCMLHGKMRGRDATRLAQYMYAVDVLYWPAEWAGGAWFGDEDRVIRRAKRKVSLDLE